MSDPVEAFAKALSAQGGPLDFTRDGLIYPGVPPSVIRDYAAARLAHRPPEAVLRAIMEGFAGPEVYARFSPHADWIFWRIARAWGVRLSELERGVRGIARAA